MDTPNYEELVDWREDLKAECMYHTHGQCFTHACLRKNGCTAARALFEAARLQETNEQLTVQLAGCSVAALGGTKEPAIQGMYGWSPAYQDVLNLRLEHDRLQEALAEAQKEKQPPLVIHNLLGKVADLEARLAECERDAARYRWMRNDPRGRRLSVSAIAWTNELSEQPEAADRAIDAAMSQNGESDERKLNASE